MANTHFPQTCRNDVKQSLIIIAKLIFCLFTPSILRDGGFFTNTVAGIYVGGFLLFAAFGIYIDLVRNKTYEIKGNIIQVITFPSRTLFILFAGLGTSLLIGNFLDVEPISNRLMTAILASLIEFIALYHLALYIALVVTYLLKSTFTRRTQSE